MEAQAHRVQVPNRQVLPERSSKYDKSTEPQISAVQDELTILACQTLQNFPNQFAAHYTEGNKEN